MLHATHVAHSGYNKILILTVDTDVVMAVALARTLEENDEVWVSFGRIMNLSIVCMAFHQCELVQWRGQSRSGLVEEVLSKLPKLSSCHVKFHL